MLDELFINFFLKLYPVSISTNHDKNINDISITFVSNNKSPFIILKIDNLLLPNDVGTLFANASIYDAC
jgi:hypothetical protein